MGLVKKDDTKCANKKVLAFEANSYWQRLDNGPVGSEARGNEVIEVS